MLLSPIELICKNTHTYVLVQWVHMHMQGPLTLSLLPVNGMCRARGGEGT